MNPFELLKNAQAIKEQMTRMQDILPTIQATGNAGAGMVTITLNGKFTVVDVTIEEAATGCQISSAVDEARSTCSAKLSKLQDEGLKAVSMAGNHDESDTLSDLSLPGTH